MNPPVIRALAPADLPRVVELVSELWGSNRLVSRNRLHFAEELPGFVAEIDSGFGGVLLYEQREEQLEVVVLVSVIERRGVGSALLAAAIEVARQTGCTRIWLVTTNDNLRAQRFYENRGWRRVAVHLGAMAEARTIKPEIPSYGIDGVAIEDEIEYDLTL